MRRVLIVLFVVGLFFWLFYCVYVGISDFRILTFAVICYICLVMYLMQDAKVKPSDRELLLFLEYIKDQMASCIKSKYISYPFGQVFKYKNLLVSLGNVIIDEKQDNVLIYQTYFTSTERIEFPDVRKFKTKNIIDCELIKNDCMCLKIYVRNYPYSPISINFSKNEPKENVDNIYRLFIRFNSNKKIT